MEKPRSVFSIGFTCMSVMWSLPDRWYGYSRLYEGQYIWKETSYLSEYLSIEQAMFDYAELIFLVKLSLNATDSPVIGFGGSYGVSHPFPSTFQELCLSTSPLLPRHIISFQALHLFLSAVFANQLSQERRPKNLNSAISGQRQASFWKQAVCCDGSRWQQCYARLL